MLGQAVKEVEGTSVKQFLFDLYLCRVTITQEETDIGC